MAHEKWETDAVGRFITWLADTGRGRWVVTGEEIIVDERNRNFDYELSSEGQQSMAVELFRLIESGEQLAEERFWNGISNQIVAELRKRMVKGYLIRSSRFRVPKHRIEEFVRTQAEIIDHAIAGHPDEQEEFKVGMFDIKRIDGFQDVSMYWIGGAAMVNPPQTALSQLEQLLTRKNEQLGVRDKRRVLFVVNWARIVANGDMLEACSMFDFREYGNIDQIYFEASQGFVELVYDRKVHDALAQVAAPAAETELSPLFLATLSNRLNHKDEIAFQIVRHITEDRGTAEWLDPLSRSQLVSYGEDFVAKSDMENAVWIVETLENDPDPEIEDNVDDAHHMIARGERELLLFSVRGRLCWLLYKLVCGDFTEYYSHILDILERYASQENLYVRLQATILLQGLAVRRLAKQLDGSPYMSDALAERVKTLSFKMLRENKQYPAILESLSTVFSFVRAINEKEALEVIDSLMPISESDSVDNLAFLLTYFALSREQHNKELGTFDSEASKRLLRTQLRSGSPRLRERLGNQFGLMLARKEISSELAGDFLREALQGEYNAFVNLHIYESTSRIGDTHPDIAYTLLEQAVTKEIEALKADARKEVWHGREFHETIQKIEGSVYADLLQNLSNVVKGHELRIHRLP